MAARTRPRVTAKQRRKAAAIQDRYQRRGVPHEEAERRALATTSDIAGGGQKGGSASGRGRRLNKAPAKSAGRVAGPTRPRRPVR